MAKNSIRDFDNTAGNNTDIQSVDIAENCAPSGINNAIRELMADMADVNDGTVALVSPAMDSADINGGTIDGTVIGGTTPAAGTFTTGDFNTSLNVDGTITSDGLTVDGAATITAADNSQLFLAASDTNPTTAIFETDAGASERVRLNNKDGDFTIDVSNNQEAVRVEQGGNVGIGTTSPDGVLEVSAGSNLNAVFDQLSMDNASNEGIGIEFSRTTSTTALSALGITDTDKLTFASREGLHFYTGGAGSYSATSERMRIDSSGNLLVGTTDSFPASSGENASGIAIGPSQSVFSKDGGAAVFVNRGTSDGAMVEFRKSGSTVGSIGVEGGDNFYITDNNNTGLNMKSGLIIPCNTDGSTRDNAIDLGASSGRFNDLYLGGSVYLGGTGSANALDDYEEGTWTPSYTAQTSNPTIDYNRRNGNYVKIGKLVKATVELRTNSISGGSGTLYISGLPFTANAPAAHTRAGTMNVGYSNDFTTLAPQSGIIDDGNTFAIPFVNNSSDARVGIDQALTVSNLTNGTGQNYLIATIIYETD